MNIINTIKQIIANLKAPRYSIIYKRNDGSTNCYVLINPSIFKGNQSVTYTNDIWRSFHKDNRAKGFRALVADKGIRSFDWSGIQAINKLSPLEMLD